MIFKVHLKTSYVVNFLQISCSIALNIQGLRQIYVYLTLSVAQNTGTMKDINFLKLFVVILVLSF